MVDVRDLLIDGIEQLAAWLDEDLDGLTVEEVNWRPGGKALSIGFHAWHITRTADNITNFLFLRKPTRWLEQGYMERFALPKADQGTGMELETAQAIQISDPALLREYAAGVYQDVVAFIRTVTDEFLAETQTLRPLGELTKWRICRQVLMTHGFMHLGEINMARGMLGKQFNM
jgi:hypothetical protein